MIGWAPEWDVITRERLERARKALEGDLPSGHPLWKPWAMDLADDVRTLAAQLEVANERLEKLEDWGRVDGGRTEEHQSDRSGHGQDGLG